MVLPHEARIPDPAAAWLQAGPWAKLLDHVEHAWPAEACGLVFASSSAARVVPVENDAGAAALRGFRIAPQALLAQLSQAEQRGERLVAFYHSHPRGSSDFSEIDRREALADDGTPWWPGVDYLVVAVEQGRAWDARAYRWDGARFAERPPGQRRG